MSEFNGSDNQKWTVALTEDKGRGFYRVFAFNIGVPSCACVIWCSCSASSNKKLLGATRRKDATIGAPGRKCVALALWRAANFKVDEDSRLASKLDCGLLVLLEHSFVRVWALSEKKHILEKHSHRCTHQFGVLHRHIAVLLSHASIFRFSLLFSSSGAPQRR